MKCANDDTKLKGIAFHYGEGVAIIVEDLNITLKELDLEYWINRNKRSLSCKKYKVKCSKATAKGGYYTQQENTYVY